MSAPTESSFDIFIIHSFNDMSLVERIQEAFSRASHKVRILVAEKRRRPGAVLTDKIKTLITDCQMVIILWTPNLEASIMANQEIGYADALGKLLFPFVFGGMSLKGLLQGCEYIECDPVNADAHIQILIKEIKQAAGRLGYEI